MKYAIDIPHFGDCADPRILADLANTSEEAGWHGFFIWDHVALDWPDSVVDATVALSAIALATNQIRFGAMVTPLPRRRPWKFARETVSLDHLSGGRLNVGVGIGVLDAEFKNMGEAPDFKTRGEMLDEGLEALTGLWGGKPWDFDDTMTYEGQYYTVRDALFWPKPVQTPRIPIWVAGMWPNKAPFRRAAKWDGVVPIHVNYSAGQMLSPGDTQDIVAFIRSQRADSLTAARTGESFDTAIAGTTTGMSQDQAASHVSEYAAAGATWWLEDLTPIHFDWEWGPPPWPMDRMRARIEAGPPKY